MSIGHDRRKEYIKEKGLLSETYNPNEILSMSTFKQRCAVSGEYLLRGLYPLQDIRYNSEVYQQSTPNSPLDGTNYKVILDGIAAKYNQCPAGPVI